MDGDQARALLGVPRAASAAEIKAAFRTAARRTHPDGGGCEAEFVLLPMARDVALGEVSDREIDPPGADPVRAAAFCGDLGRRFRERTCAPPRPLIDLCDAPSRIPRPPGRPAAPTFEEVLSSVRAEMS